MLDETAAPEPVTLRTADGLALEGQLGVPPDAWAAVVLAHPHPQFGGTMRSIVTGALFDGLYEHGVAVLRFNFRGVGASEGQFDDGRGERLDVVAGIDVLHPITEGLPLVVSGWSFGAETSFAVDDERHAGWFAVAPPLRADGDDTAAYPAAHDPRPKVVVLAEHDQYRPPAEAVPILSTWTATDVEVVPGADHYFVGRTDRVVDLGVTALRRLA